MANNGSTNNQGNLVTRVVQAVQNSLTGTGPQPAATAATAKRKATTDGDTPRAKKTKLILEEFNTLRTNYGSDTCSICLEPWHPWGIHRATTLKCGHIFGYKCIFKWLRRVRTCPYCQQYSTLLDVRYVFRDIGRKKRLPDALVTPIAATNAAMAVSAASAANAARRAASGAVAAQNNSTGP